MPNTDNTIFICIAAAIVILVLVYGGKVCADRFKETFSDTSRNIPFEEPIFYEPGQGTLMRGGPVFQSPFGIYNMGGRPYSNYGNPMNTGLFQSLGGRPFREEFYGPPGPWALPPGPPDPSWGGGFRHGPVAMFGPGFIPGDQYGPLPPSRRPFGGRCDCHYTSGHIKYDGGKCYRPWGPKIDPRDSCYDLRNF